jgi:DNA-binding PadR family transcriptional regulator
MTGPKPRASALSPEFALLGLLRLEPGHGYEIHQRLQQELGALWTVHQNQAYNILHRLEAAGYVRSLAPDPGGGARLRRRFHLTLAGRRRFDAWLRRPSGLSVRALRIELLTRLYFARRLDPDLARQIIEAQLAVTRAGIERLRQARPPSAAETALEDLSTDLRLRQLGLAIDWLESLRTPFGTPLPHEAGDPAVRPSRRRRLKPGSAKET